MIKKIEREKLWTLGPPENPTPLQQFRYDIQQKFVAYKLKNKMSQREMAKVLGVDETKVSKILRNRLESGSSG